jgi:hypothetical protein
MAAFGLAGAISDFVLGSEDGFRTAYVFELFDNRSPAVAQAAHVFVVNPRVYRLSEPFTATLTPAEDNTVVAEENGIIIRELTIEGTFGIKERKATQFFGVGPVLKGNAAGKDTISGTEHFLALRNLFRLYSDLKKDPNAAPFIELVFHSLRDDDHFIVIPKAFETPRDARTTRMHFEYRIVLQAIGEPSEARKRREKDRDEHGFWDAVGDISAALNDARAAFADGTAFLAKARRKIQNIDAILIQVGSVVTAAGNFLRAQRTLFIDVPIAIAANACETLAFAADELADVTLESADFGEMHRHLKRMERALNRIQMFPEKFYHHGSELRSAYQGEAALTQQDLIDGTAGATIGSRTRVTLGSGREGGLNLGAFRGVRLYEVKAGDSIASISNRFSVPQELIIVTNDLRPPYINDSGGPGLRKPGDQLLIPTTQGVRGRDTAPSTTEDDYISPEDALYGVDIALDPVILKNEGRLEIKVDDEHEASDVALVRGLANAVQGIAIIINTEIGTTIPIPELGIRRSVGHKGTFQHLVLSALNLRDAILSDTRVQEIESSEIVLDADVLSQTITPRLIGDRNVSVTVPFGHARGAS